MRPPPPPHPSADLLVLSADGTGIPVRLFGPIDAPPVVLIHGRGLSATAWAPVIRRLAAAHLVIAYDQRGHGSSTATPPHGTTHLADDLCAVLTACLAPGERAVLAGHCLGGAVILAAAARPDFRAHTAAAVLCATGPGCVPGDREAIDTAALLAPSVLLAGDADRYVSPTATRQLANGLPRSVGCALLRGVRHNLPRDAPTETAAAIRAAHSTPQPCRRPPATHPSASNAVSSATPREVRS